MNKRKGLVFLVYSIIGGLSLGLSFYLSTWFIDSVLSKDKLTLINEKKHQTLDKQNIYEKIKVQKNFSNEKGSSKAKAPKALNTSSEIVESVPKAQNLFNSQDKTQMLAENVSKEENSNALDPNFVQEEDAVETALSVPSLPVFKINLRRDLFLPFQTVLLDKALPAAVPLGRFKLGNLRLVGIVWDIRKPKAMIMDPESTVHVLNVDDRIGRDNGYIAAIREGEVIVVQAKDVKGEIVYNTVKMIISK